MAVAPARARAATTPVWQVVLQRPAGTHCALQSNSALPLPWRRAPPAAIMRPMLWIKGFHVLAVMAWMAGIFYLPRIFVHYAEGRAAGEDVRRLVIMAGRLYGFMTLMALFALGLGVWLWQVYAYSGLWLRLKLLFVLGLIRYHLACRVLVELLRAHAPVPRGYPLRWFNDGALRLVGPMLVP